MSSRGAVAMTRIELPEPRRYVFIDCKSKKTGAEWKHFVDAEHAEASARSIERRFRGTVKATVRR